MDAKLEGRAAFQPSGPLREGALYLLRPADEQLPGALLQGELCYLAAPPGSGKSSLRARVSRLLAAQGVRCASIDLSRMGTRVSAEGFYYALMGQMAEGLSLPDPTEFWIRRESTPPVRRFAAYLRDEALSWLAQPIVVFIDGIDAVRGLGAKADTFFATLDEVYKDRAADSACRRLSFCLIGTSAAHDLAIGPGRLPAERVLFIDLPDFTTRQAEGLLGGLIGVEGDRLRLLQRVLYWTDGHPQLTQTLCHALCTGGAARFGAGEDRRVDELVEQGILHKGPRDPDDPVLLLASRRFDALIAGPHRSQALSLYRRLLFGERVPAPGTTAGKDEPPDPALMELRLCGMVKEYVDGAGHAWLRVRNRIFETLFSRGWIEDRGHTGILSAGLIRWLRSGKHTDHVLRGRDLDEALSYTGQERTPDEEEYLRAGLALRQEEELRVVQGQLRDEQRLRREERQVHRRERLWAVALLLGLLTTSSVAIVVLQRRAEWAWRAERLSQAQAGEMGQLLQKEKERADGALKRWQKATVRLGQAERGAYAALSEGLLLPGPGQEALLPVLRGHQGYVRGAAISPDGKQVATTGDDQTVRLWDAHTGKAGAVLRGHSGLVRGVVFSPDGKQVATVSNDHTARLWSTAPDGEVLVLRGHSADVRSAAFSPDGKRMVTSSGDGTVRMWDTQKGQLLFTLRGHDKDVLGAIFSHDGKEVATASQDRTARIWQGDTGKPLFTLLGHEGPVVSVAFSPDDSRVLTASADGTARLWDSAGRLLQTLKGHEDGVLWAAFSPDGKQVVTCGQDRTARLWDATTFASLAVLSGHQGPVISASWSPDGMRLVTASQDHTARLWDKSGRLQTTLLGHTQGLFSAAFSPDGQSVVTTSADRTARIYPTSEQRFVELACQLARAMPDQKAEEGMAAYCAQ